MGTITTYTPEKIDEILDGTITSGSMSGDDLLLTRRDSSVFNAGSARGGAGADGADGEVSNAAFAAQLSQIKPGAWSNLALSSSWTLSGIPSGMRPLRYRRIGDTVEFDGAAVYTGSSTAPNGTSTISPAGTIPPNTLSSNLLPDGVSSQWQKTFKAFEKGIYPRNVGIAHLFYSNSWVSYMFVIAGAAGLANNSWFSFSGSFYTLL